MTRFHRQLDYPADGRPWLSLDERDRRWALARRYLGERGLDAMIVAGLRGRERYDTYFSGEAYEGVVVLPLEGDPVYLVTQAHRITLRHERANEDITPWIADARAGVRMFDGVAEVLEERGLARAGIAVIGLESRGPMEMEGLITFDAWQGLIGRLPGASFVDVSEDFSLRMLPKSAEELEVARAAAAVGEQACEAMLEATRVGATDAEVYAAVLWAIQSAGAYTTHPHLLLRCGPDTFGWGPPNTFTSGARPRVIEDGDIVLAEIFSCLAGIETQQEMTIAVGSAGERMASVGEASRASYEAGLRALVPGSTFARLCEEMDRPLLEGGFWHLGPNVHTVSPLTMVDAAFRGVESLDDLPETPRLRSVPSHGDGVIEAGSLFVLEPNAVRGRNRALIGGTVIVHPDRVEELNTIPCRLHVID